MIEEEIKFSCRQCSWCCRFEGGVVRLSKEDLENLCAWSNLTEDQFKKVYCRTAEDDSGNRWLILKTLQNGDCIFWKKDLCDGKGGCECYSARPVQCSTFPFWTDILKDRESWNREALHCPGINFGKTHTAEETAAELEKYKKRIPLKSE